MTDYIKVTNITNIKDPNSKGFVCNIGNQELKPGTSVFMKESDLPKNWDTLQDMLSFEFPVTYTEVSKPITIGGVSMEDLKEIIDESIKNALCLYAPKSQVIVQEVNLPKVVSKISIPEEAFIPSIAPVDASDIQIKSTSVQGESVTSIKDKLKKMGKG